MREWIVTLIREAVRAEVGSQLTALQDKAAATEAALSGITVRVKDRTEAAKKPLIGKQWGSIAREAERKSESEA